MEHVLRFVNNCIVTMEYTMQTPRMERLESQEKLLNHLKEIRYRRAIKEIQQALRNPDFQ